VVIEISIDSPPPGVHTTADEWQVNNWFAEEESAEIQLMDRREENKSEASVRRRTDQEMLANHRAVASGHGGWRGLFHLHVF
jgi:hypothetical protein